MAEDKDMFVIWCNMVDTTHRKENIQVYVAIYVDDLVCNNTTKTFITMSIKKILQALSKGINKKMRENPEFRVSHMKADIVKEGTLKFR